MRSWDTRKLRAADRNRGFDGKWIDVGIGECQRCHTERRMYRPVSRFDVHLCAPCTQTGLLVALPNHDREEEAA